jgi:hypothetical protein
MGTRLRARFRLGARSRTGRYPRIPMPTSRLTSRLSYEGCHRSHGDWEDRDVALIVSSILAAYSFFFIARERIRGARVVLRVFL